MVKKKSLKKAQNKLDKWFLLSWRKLWVVVVVGIVSAILHNLIYALFNVEEAFFFIIVIFLLPLYFIIMILYTIINKIKRR